MSQYAQYHIALAPNTLSIICRVCVGAYECFMMLIPFPHSQRVLASCFSKRYSHKYQYCFATTFTCATQCTFLRHLIAFLSFSTIAKDHYFSITLQKWPFFICPPFPLEIMLQGYRIIKSFSVNLRSLLQYRYSCIRVSYCNSLLGLSAKDHCFIQSLWHLMAFGCRFAFKYSFIHPFIQDVIRVFTTLNT